MAATTPHVPAHDALGPLESRQVTIEDVPWQPMGFPGVEHKVLIQDKETGLLTSLIRMAPGAVLPPHEHTAIEQTYVLQGSLVDDHGAVTAGNYVWRPAGSKHTARAPEGALYIAFFMAPNRFFAESGQT
jgi:anti-sigma factor ChrR (cupin superfamily)